MKEKNFKFLLSGQFISKTGDAMHELAFALLALDAVGQDYLSLGIIYSFRFLPYATIGLYGGHFADTLNKKKLILATDASRFLLTGLFALFVHLDRINLAGLIAFSFLMTAARTIFQPGCKPTSPNS